VRVAVRLVVPPYVPVAGETATLVAVVPPTSLKQTPTLDSDGVALVLLVERNAA
jgi:hypothetical protein